MFAGVDKFLAQKEIFDNNEITLTNARGAFAGPLAEYTILAMLHFNYNVPTYMECQEKHQWKKLTNTMIDKRNWLCKCHRCGLYIMHDGAISNGSVILTESQALRVKTEFENEFAPMIENPNN